MKTPQEISEWVEKEIKPQHLPGRVKIELTQMIEEAIQLRDRKQFLETTIRGHMEAMRPLLEEWSK